MGQVMPDQHTLKVGIIGCGLIGNKRAACLGQHQLIAVADQVGPRARQLAERYGAKYYTDWRSVIDDGNIEVVIVATTPDVMPVITKAAVEQGKHVLVDKPAARNAHDLEPVLSALEGSKAVVRVGFNHRYHPALAKARQLVDEGVLGELLYVRGRYGHGGRLGYEKEWRCDPRVSGGGEMLDQGTHLIDLSRWFLGEMVQSQGFAHTYFWNMPVEDNAFMLLRTAQNQAAWLHVSWSEWKNMFSYELFGRHGKLQIDGLGGSYGTETLTHYQMKREMGPPEIFRWEYPQDGSPNAVQGDQSWKREFDEFVLDIERQRHPSPGILDAYATLKIVGEIYAQNKIEVGASP